MAAKATHRRAGTSDLLAPRDRRGLAMAAGAGLAVLVVLAIGVGLGRATAPGERASDAIEVAAPGPSRTVSGVPVGYSRTEAGAVSAAANYTAVLGGKQNIDPAYGQEVYPVFALPDVVEDLLRRSRDFAGTVDDAAALAGDSRLVLRAAPVGYRVENYSPEEATVTVWAVATGVGTEELPLATAWGAEQLTLRWIDDDWRVAGIERDAGPTPPSEGAPAADDLAARIDGFEPFVYLPGAAE